MLAPSETSRNGGDRPFPSIARLRQRGTMHREPWQALRSIREQGIMGAYHRGHSHYGCFHARQDVFLNDVFLNNDVWHGEKHRL